jgi:hypothetical protein
VQRVQLVQRVQQEFPYLQESLQLEVYLDLAVDRPVEVLSWLRVLEQ